MRLTSTIVCDASYDDVQKLGGWAAWVRVDGFQEPIKGYGSFKFSCKNSTTAEIQAAFNGLYLATTNGATVALVRSDCLAVHNMIMRQTKSKEQIRMWQRYLENSWMRGVTITSQHVKGHGDKNRSAAAWVNDWCDKKAKLGLKAARRQQQLLRIE